MQQSYWVVCPKCGYPHFVKRYRETVYGISRHAARAAKTKSILHLRAESLKNQ